MATKSKTPGARGRAARAQRRRAVQQQVRASATASATPGGDSVTLAAVESFNEGRRAEHAERRFFKLPESERAL